MITLCFVSLVLVAFVALLIIGLAVVLLPPKRARLVGAIERSNPQLLDRLNTLWFLNRGEETPVDESFRYRVARQVRMLLRQQRLASPAAPTRAWLQVLLCVAIAVFTIWFYIAYAPLNRAAVADKPHEAESPLVIPEDPPQAVAEIEQWHEVRIVRPGRNMAVAKEQSVALQIEVASSQPRSGAGWHTAVNGGDELDHALADVADPRYALYEPTIELADFGLQTWDLLTYYADATLETGGVFTSDVYSIEVRPPADELDDLPGGPEGAPLAFLNQLTGLIDLQQEAVRASHHQHYSPSTDPAKRDRQRQWLAAVEKEMAATTDHLAAMIDSQFDASAVQPTTARLDAASRALTDAANAYRQAEAEASRRPARTALSALLAARKQLYESLTDNPEAFDHLTPDAQPSEGALREDVETIANVLKTAENGIRSMRDLAAAQEDVAKQSRQTQSAMWSVFTTAVNNGRPVDDITEISIDAKRVFIFVSWRGLTNDQHLHACKIFDGQGRRVENDTMQFTPTRRVWRAWNWHDFNQSVDAPGDWNFQVFLDGRQVIDKNLKVLPSGVKPKPPQRGPVAPPFEPVDSSAIYRDLADREETLQRDLAALEQDHPEIAQRVQRESASAKKALQTAAQSLRDKERDARLRTASG
jgi:hypothetical protein